MIKEASASRSLSDRVAGFYGFVHGVFVANLRVFKFHGGDYDIWRLYFGGF